LSGVDDPTSASWCEDVTSKRGARPPSATLSAVPFDHVPPPDSRGVGRWSLRDRVDLLRWSLVHSRVLALLALILVPTAAAYRGLIGFEPNAGHSGGLEGTEELLFAPSSSSPWLILAVTGWPIVRRWPRFRGTIGLPGRPFTGVVLLSAAALLCIWAYYVRVPTFLVPSLSLFLLGAGAWLGGGRGCRALVLPALFLLLAAPVPLPIVNRIIYSLQLATAEVTGAILSAVGVNVFVVGERIYAKGSIFQVIESCSGLRTMITMLMAAVVYQELFYRGRLHSALLIGAAPLLGMLTNQVRVMGIVLNPYSQFAAVHTAQGLVMIVLGIFLLAGLDVVLGRLLPGQWSRPGEPPFTPGGPVEEPGSVSLSRALVLGGALTLLACATFLVQPWQPPGVRGPSLSAIPARLGAWSVVRGLPLDRQFLGSVNPSEWVHRRYERGRDHVDLFVAADRRYEPYVDLWSPKTAIPASGWEIVTRRPAPRLDNGRGELLYALSLNEGALVYHWRIGSDSSTEELFRAVLSLDRGPWRRPGRMFVARLTTPVESPGGELAAERRLREFAPLVKDELAKLAP